MKMMIGFGSKRYAQGLFSEYSYMKSIEMIILSLTFSIWMKWMNDEVNSPKVASKKASSW